MENKFLAKVGVVTFTVSEASKYLAQVKNKNSSSGVLSEIFRLKKLKRVKPINTNLYVILPNGCPQAITRLL